MQVAEHDRVDLAGVDKALQRAEGARPEVQQDGRGHPVDGRAHQVGRGGGVRPGPRSAAPDDHQLGHGPPPLPVPVPVRRSLSRSRSAGPCPSALVTVRRGLSVSAGPAPSAGSEELADRFDEATAHQPLTDAAEVRRLPGGEEGP
ncbi:hypothetical protein SDC9_137864 [bioreactor metagenome]|uniref:Uncharacterized protein n=1 Tax=bioreactor metagenome TaxID=1076179 RepID=A0A645DQI6_9ZZZZ